MPRPPWLPALKVVHRIRTPLRPELKYAQQLYDSLLAELLVRDARDPTKRIGRMMGELKDKRILSMARAEYVNIFAGLVGVLAFCLNMPLGDQIFRLVWRPYTKRLQPQVHLLALVIQGWLLRQSTSGQADLRQSANVPHLLRRPARAWKDGVLSEVDRLHAYRNDSEPGRGHQLTKLFGPRRSREPIDRWARKAVRDRRDMMRKLGLPVPAARRASSQGLTTTQWRVTAVCAWLAPLVPDFLTEHEGLGRRPLEQRLARLRTSISSTRGAQDDGQHLAPSKLPADRIRGQLSSLVISTG